MDGLIYGRSETRALPFKKSICMIDTDHVAIDNVSGSHQLGRVLHEVITLSNLGQRPLDSCML